MPLSDFYPELKGWTPAPNVSPTALPQLPTPEVQVSPLLRATLPLPLVYAPDTLKQSNRPGLSSFRISPQSPSSFPAINSAAKSAVTSTIIQAIANAPSSGAGISSLAYAGNEFSIANPTGPATVINKLPEPVHTFWAAPIPGLTSLTGTFTNGYSVRTTPATHPTIIFTPPSTGWALYTEAAAGGTSTAPTGWTAWGDMGALSIAATSPITATDGLGNARAW